MGISVLLCFRTDILVPIRHHLESASSTQLLPPYSISINADAICNVGRSFETHLEFAFRNCPWSFSVVYNNMLLRFPHLGLTFHEYSMQLEHLAWLHIPEGRILFYSGH